MRSKKRRTNNQYFGNIVYEASRVMPEEIDEQKYSIELPQRVAYEYFEFLNGILKELYPNDEKDITIILDKAKLALDCLKNDKDQLESAYRDAKIITLWEKITKTNHEDVTYYKGLLKVYTEEILKWMGIDFVEDIV